MSTVLTLLCLCSLTLWTTADGKVLTPQLTSRIEAFVENLMQCRKGVGLSLAVVKGNETWTRGFGMADKASGRLVNSSTLFGIGSVTKAFTSTILAMLIEESRGKYTWQTPIKDILGNDFQLADEYLTSHVTIKDILLHRTGLTTSIISLYAGYPATFTREQFTNRLQYLPASGLFRDEWNYNNWMYGLAGRVAEVMGGASWEELLHQRIFQPLQMNDSRVIGYDVEVDVDNFALPYVYVRNELVLSDPVIYHIHPDEPAGAIASSADDMAKWLSWHLHGGVTSDGDVILNKTTLQDMYTPRIILSPQKLTSDAMLKPQFPVTYQDFGYGYAWVTSSYRGYPIVWHSGGINSYITYLSMLRDLDLGIFMTTNGYKSSDVKYTLEEILYYITDLFLGEEPWLNTTNACQFPQPWVNTTGQTPSNDTNIVPGNIENPQDFAGQYENRLFGNIVVAQNGSNELLVTYGRITGKLYKTKDRNVLVMEIYGLLEFLTHPGDSLQYYNLTFTRGDQNVKYQQLLFSAATQGPTETLVYSRTNVSAPTGDTLIGRYQVVWHSGLLHRYDTRLYLLKDVDLAVFITTSGHEDRNVKLTIQEIFFYITDLFLGEEPWLNTTNACQFPQPWVNTTGQTPSNDTNIVPGDIENPQDFVGQYENRLFGNIVVAQNGSSELLVTYGRITGKLYKTKDRNVLMMEIYGLLEFLTHPEDSVQYYNLTFTRGDQNVKYQQLLFSEGPTETLVYSRVSDSASPSDTTNGSSKTLLFPIVTAFQCMVVQMLVSTIL
ncbi:hypothetical protein C0Q70_06334 [Pomacea canaliculata]|uniref:Beta-lactamase-related domain-containing protein n=2 Tax=Pomacea canaliculata TaxID=400727 RepID=A0A2T7PNQ1_POMCA|nr:hypothetical protein C0Q70_06334 [Pomacea canaliculata]